MNLHDEIEKALNEALRAHIARMVEILMSSTDSEETALGYFRKGAAKAIARHKKLVALLAEHAEDLS